MCLKVEKKASKRQEKEGSSLMMQETEDEKIQRLSNKIRLEKGGVRGDHGKENGYGCP